MATEAPTPAQIKETLELLSEKGKLTEEQLLKEAQLQERIAKAVGDVQEANKQKLIQNQQDFCWKKFKRWRLITSNYLMKLLNQNKRP